MSESQRQTRIRKFIAAKYGEPKRRCFLGCTEALELTKASPFGRAATCDLDLTRHAGYWVCSVEESIGAGLHVRQMEFWVRARAHFLGLGGTYRLGWEAPQGKD